MAVLNDEALERFKNLYTNLCSSMKATVRGQDEVVEKCIKAVLTGGHILVQGTPGLGKSLVTHQLSRLLNLEHARISFTPDMMPSDILGTMTMTWTDETRSSKFRRGPIFSQIVLAEELNRTTPKTQSALLEAMQERTVSIHGTTYTLPTPFFVFATQNPEESADGTYALPDAQLDRFLFRMDMKLPSHDSLSEIFRGGVAAKPSTAPVIGGADVEDFHAARAEVVVSQAIAEVTARLIAATWPDRDLAPDSLKRFVRFGASVRAGIAAIAAAQTNALSSGRSQVILEDLHWAFSACLPHRIRLNFEGEAEGVAPADILKDVWTSVYSRLK